MKIRNEIHKSYKFELYFLGILVLIAIIINYPFMDAALIDFLKNEPYMITGKICNVTRIVDGDTLIACANSTRLLGINTPEKGEKYSLEAKEFLENKTLGKQVQLIFGRDKTDRYGRTLAYIFLDSQNVNLEIVKNGFANFYFPSGKDNFYNDFKNAFDKCLELEINICEKSRNICTNCIKLKEIQIKEQVVTFENICHFDCDMTDWEIKDEGRKKFIFPEFVLHSEDKIDIINDKNCTNQLCFSEDYVWTKGGDSLFLRDNLGKLILWDNY